MCLLCILPDPPKKDTDQLHSLEATAQAWKMWLICFGALMEVVVSKAKWNGIQMMDLVDLRSGNQCVNVLADSTGFKTHFWWQHIITVWALPRTLELHGRLGVVLGREWLAGLFTRVRPRPSSQASFLVLTSMSLRSLYNYMILHVCNVYCICLDVSGGLLPISPTDQPFEAAMKSASVRYSWLLGWGMISIFSMYVLLTNVTVGHPIGQWIGHRIQWFPYWNCHSGC